MIERAGFDTGSGIPRLLRRERSRTYSFHACPSTPPLKFKHPCPRRPLGSPVNSGYLIKHCFCARGLWVKLIERAGLQREESRVLPLLHLDRRVRGSLRARPCVGVLALQQPSPDTRCRSNCAGLSIVNADRPASQARSCRESLRRAGRESDPQRLADSMPQLRKTKEGFGPVVLWPWSL